MDKKGMISASMMCADLIHLKKHKKLFEENKIEYLHIDIMDGDFVPNLGLGVDYVRGLRELTDIPLDLHFMVTRPDEKLGWFGIKENDRIIIHYESTNQLQRTLEKAKTYGAKVMLALNPGTAIYVIEEVLDYIDGITVLTVNPGFAGQKIVASSIKKVGKLKNYLNEMGYQNMDIEVDGNISFENAEKLRLLGANIFVAGTSSIFKKNGDMSENITRLRKSIQ